jgi:hypothetical protein
LVVGTVSIFIVVILDFLGANKIVNSKKTDLMLEAVTPSSLAAGLVRAASKPALSFCCTIRAISAHKTANKV